MKKTAVKPVGILSSRRQRQLIDGLGSRFEICGGKLDQLANSHRAEVRHKDADLEEIRSQQIDKCRQQRRSLLEGWDQKQEEIIANYETQTVEKRTQLSRLSVRYRRKLDEQIALINEEKKKCQEDFQKQYALTKKQVDAGLRRDVRRADEERDKYHQYLNQINAVVLKRLDGLPNSDQSDEQAPPKAPIVITDEFDFDQFASNQIDQINDELKRMVSTKLARLVESWFLPILGIILAVLWVLATRSTISPPGGVPRLVWIAGGIMVSGVLTFAGYLVLMFPLKKQTRAAYPGLIRQATCFGQELQIYKQWLGKKASQADQDLIQKRDLAIQAVKQQSEKKLARTRENLASEQETLQKELEQDLQDTDTAFSELQIATDTEMREKADNLAAEISNLLTSMDGQIASQRSELLSDHADQVSRLKDRMQSGLKGVSGRILEVNESVEKQFPAWEKVVDGGAEPLEQVDYLPIGKLKIGDWIRSTTDAMAEKVVPSLPSKGDGTSGSRGDWGFGLPHQVPVALHRRLHCGMMVTAEASQMPKAVDFIHQILWRLLASLQALRAKLLLIDPLGRGQNFTNFMALADYDPQLVGHRVWTTEEMIEARLGELTQHAEDVLLSCLRDRFERIEDYNQVAGALAEPYSIIAAVGFPVGLNRSSYRHLNALIESGSRCGNFVVMVSERDKAWPSDMPLPDNSKLLRIDVNGDGEWRLLNDNLDEFAFLPEPAPKAEQRTKLVDFVGNQAITASRVEVPLRQLIEETNESFEESADGLTITLGTQGAGRPLSLAIGEGVKQHVLIAGKTGSGKSTLLHALITAGAIKYRPDQLLYYLLDFKKGVEFKSYADSDLPHARIIGIESEREFGKSVLQRLDQVLQERGEEFRSYGVQSLAQYRKQSGKKLPRIMLIVDEFQELFVRDDRLASECTMLLDRIVRQGRSFGLHVVLSSQSLAGAYSLPRATLGQMAIRVAMQCSESDAALILSDDNTAAKLIQRPGEAIYNDAGGLIEGNHPFQVAWVSNEEHERMLKQVTQRDIEFEKGMNPRVIFEGNRPGRWNASLADEALKMNASDCVVGLLGEAVEIGPPVSILFRSEPGRNVLAVASEEIRFSIQSSIMISMLKSKPNLKMIIFDGSRNRTEKTLWEIMDLQSFDIRSVKPRDCENEILEIENLIQTRLESEETHSPIVIFIDPLERFRELRQDEGFSFALGGDQEKKSAATAFQNILRDGPSVGVYSIVSCASVETLSRWLPRASQRDLELRVLGQMNPSDSSFLMDSSAASELTPATILLYDDADGRIQKCRICEQPDPSDLSLWLDVDRL